MLSFGRNSPTESRSPLLPLFRQEALAAQEKTHGEILLARPLSLTLLTWLFLGIAAAGFAFLFAGHYDETTRVSGSFKAVQPGHDFSRDALFLVPSKATRLMRAGASLPLQWQSCVGQPQRFAGTVIEITPPSSLSIGKNMLVSSADRDIPVRVTIALPSTFAALSDREGRLDAVIPLGRQRLIHWFFARNKG